MPVSTDPLPDQPPDQPPAGEPSATEPDPSPAAAAAAAEPGEYPKTMVKGPHSRRAESQPQEVRLRHDGWRAADEPPVTRGGFLPPVSRPVPAPEPADTAATDDPATGQPPAARRRRKPADTPPTE